MANLEIEKSYNSKFIIGVDEAGRGPLAGPVVAAGVMTDQANIIEGINDSKKLSKRKREELYDFIVHNYKYSVAVVSAEEIDKINILQATIKACKMVVQDFSSQVDIALIDGNMKFEDDRFKSIVKGDSKSISIAAGSIIAKVTRDRIMEKISHEFPMYGWQNNSGYGTKEHLNAIAKFGICKYHRKTFKGCY